MKHGEDYGAAMLQALETKLQAGEITQAQHDAERERALEAIRRGRTVYISPARRAIAIICSAILVLGGLVFAGATQTPAGVIVGAAILLAGVFGIRRSL